VSDDAVVEAKATMLHCGIVQSAQSECGVGFEIGAGHSRVVIALEKKLKGDGAGTRAFRQEHGIDPTAGGILLW
jgi:hypothetical protein